jgi:hypothetical protein
MPLPCQYTLGAGTLDIQKHPSCQKLLNWIPDTLIEIKSGWKIKSCGTGYREERLFPAKSETLLFHADQQF